jgi:4-amino-4-deoxy-L-arabinose transferase-like glycosyltransferase
LRLRGRRAIPQVLVVALLAFMNAGVWSLVVPNFEGPDEPAHVAYVGYFAETGKLPGNPALPFSSDEQAQAEGGLRTFQWLQFAGVMRPPWLGFQDREYKRYRDTHPANRKNGGGLSTAYIHGPVYYALPAAAYRVLSSSSFESRILGMRLASALLGALAVAFVYLTVAELVPRRRWAPLAAALLVAFQPMFSFMSGVVNADVGVNAAAAAFTYFLICAIRRGLTLRLAIAVPLSFVLGFLAKATMGGLFLPLLLGLGVLLWRRSGRLVDWAAMAGVFAVLGVAWVLAAHAWHHSILPVPEAGSDVNAVGIGAKLSYIWQAYLPRLPFMAHHFPDHSQPFWTVYIMRSWGTFGWLDVNLPQAFFVGIAVVIGVVFALAVRGLALERAAVRERIWEIVLLVFIFVCVSGFTHYAYATNTPGIAILEQGRYLFPAITVPAAAAVAACFGLGRRLAPVGAVVMVTAMMLLCCFAQAVTFSAYFT